MQLLLDVLHRQEYTVLGPTLREGAIVYDEIRNADQLPVGWTDEQEGGTCRLKRKDGPTLFDYAVGPHSWKRFLFPPRRRLWSATRGEEDVSFQIHPEPEDAPRMAFLGVHVNADRLTPQAQEAALQAGLEPPCRNPFKSILVRLAEVVHACDTALQLIGRYEPPERPFVDVQPRAGTGYGCTEAPRGLCWHRYRIDDEGLILDARIIPPTSQNLMMMEHDLRHFVSRHLELPDDELRWTCEQVIRNYDPCISCSAHFLHVHIDRA